MIYRATGNIRAIQILLGHTKMENTVRYLGVDVEDALLLAECTEVQPEKRPLGRPDRPLLGCLTYARIVRDWVGRGRPNFRLRIGNSRHSTNDKFCAVRLP